MKYQTSILSFVFMLLGAMGLLSSSYAKSITLYDQPQAGAKIIGFIDSSNLVPIFKEGNWVKVGNQQNGTVGWINSSDLISTEISLPNSNPINYQATYGSQQNVTNEQAQKALQSKQQAVQQSMQIFFQNFINDVGDMYQYQWNKIQNRKNVIMPIMFPVPQMTQPNQATQIIPTPSPPATNSNKTIP